MTCRAVFTDLDDTLFSSLRSAGLSGASKEDLVVRGLQPAAFLSNGEPVCYSNPKQRAFLSMLQGTADVFVAVTARSVDSFSRAQVMESCDYAVCSNGAVILEVGGGRLADWSDLVLTRLQNDQQAMRDFLDSRAQWAVENELRHWLVEEQGIGPIYYCAKSNRGDSDHLASVVDALVLDSPAWASTVHLNGNNLALLPGGISKLSAVEYLIARLREDNAALVTIGVGDSATDWDFMRGCDYAITPTDSQLLYAASSGVREFLAR